jgi:hypothetical protein
MNVFIVDLAILSLVGQGRGVGSDSSFFELPTGVSIDFQAPCSKGANWPRYWTENGLTSVKETALTIWMEFRDFADYRAAYAWQLTIISRGFPKRVDEI